MALIFCSHCGKQVSDKATTCPHCNAVLQAGQPQVQPQTAQQPFQQNTNATQQSVYVNVPGKQSNGIGTTGWYSPFLESFLGGYLFLGGLSGSSVRFLVSSAYSKVRAAAPLQVSLSHLYG
ncbi:zinc ribbon domain-containing protein [Bacteroides sp. D20]|uniref:zinc ribbon domain-containing protein n=1 Tax=Bacteroides sp. D20 TaxID=585543 RepID=UPI002540F12A|nr:zinc ribbon domain-containing protein [Bacteroides sp. D20]